MGSDEIVSQRQILSELHDVSTKPIAVLQSYADMLRYSEHYTGYSLLCAELATRHYYRGDDVAVIKCLALADNAYKGRDEDLVYARVLSVKGALAYRQRHYDEAIRYFSRAKAIARGLHCHLDEAMNCHSLSAVYHDSSQLQESLDELLAALELLPEVEFDVASDKRQHNLYTASTLAFTPDGFVELQKDCSHVLSGCFNNLGNVYVLLGDEQKAIVEYSKGLELCDHAKPTLSFGMISNQIGECYLRAGDYEHATLFFNQSVEVFQSLQTAGTLLACVCKNIGRVRYKCGDYQLAAAWYERALETYRQVRDTHGEADLRCFMTELRLESGQNFSPEDSRFLQETLEMAQGIRALNTVIRAMHLFGKALATSNPKQGYDYLMKALLLADEMGYKQEQCSLHREMSFYHKLKGESSLALLHYEKYHHLEKEIQSEEAARHSRNLAIMHRLEKFKQESAEIRLQLEQANNQLELKATELQSFARQIVDKQEFLGLIETGLHRVLEAKPSEKDAQVLRLLQKVREGSNVEVDLANFREQFQGIQVEFIQRVSRIYPDLSPTELKICTLLRMNLRSKDIAEMLNVSTKTIENHRLHLRQKLGLKRDESLLGALLLADGDQD